MIKRLFIKDFAIINELELSIKDGLTIITGETGAGKSIILKSLGIALGSKADKVYVRSGQDKSVIEAEVDDSAGSVFRRLISKAGRVRSFINEEPISEADYRSATKVFADFHGQNEQQFIMNPKTHVDFLDRFCGLEDKVLEIESCYNDYITIDQQITDLKELSHNASSKKELIEFQLNEINSVDPKVDEDIELTTQFKRLNNVDELISTLKNLNQSLTENEHSIYRQLSSAISDLDKISNYDDSIKSYVETIKQSSIAIQDASSGLLNYADGIDNDPSLILEVEERLHSIERLKRKYGGSIESVHEYLNEALEELDELSNVDKKIDSLNEEKNYLIAKYQRLADDVHRIRSNSAKEIDEQIQNEMFELNIPKAQFVISITNKNDPQSNIRFDNVGVVFGPKGYDQVEFFFSANPGESPKPLSKIASGGEVSRIMLAIKSVLKKSDPVPTLVFDEIDAGISGQAAEKVSEALEKLSKDKQVICITHLPQIASKADHHIYISKEIGNEKTVVSARYLSEDEKVHAIAELFSGEIIPSEGLNTAKQFRTQARG